MTREPSGELSFRNPHGWLLPAVPPPPPVPAEPVDDQGHKGFSDPGRGGYITLKQKLMKRVTKLFKLFGTMPFSHEQCRLHFLEHQDLLGANRSPL